jgi:DNA polymerase/3'-5' exonuclease PolX
MVVSNSTIISEFKKLIKQIQNDIDHSESKKQSIVDMYRLSSIKKVIKILEEYPHRITSSEQLKGIPGVGKSSLSRIDEILKTGKLSEIKEIKNVNEETIEELSKIHGIGRKKAYELINKFNIKSISELKKAVKSGKITLPEGITKGLKYVKYIKEHIPRSEMDSINAYIQNIIPTIDKKLSGIICGSYRRLKDFSNDIDILLVHPKIKTKDDVEEKSYIEKVVTKLKKDGFIIDSLSDEAVTTKLYMGICKWDKNPMRRIDIRMIPYESYYFSLLYFTGSKDTNKKMRQVAIDMGYKLNEYGLFDENGKPIHVSSEKEIFNLLGLEYISPEKR